MAEEERIARIDQTIGRARQNLSRLEGIRQGSDALAADIAAVRARADRTLNGKYPATPLAQTWRNARNFTGADQFELDGHKKAMEDAVATMQSRRADRSFHANAYYPACARCEDWIRLWQYQIWHTNEIYTYAKQIR